MRISRIITVLNIKFADTLSFLYLSRIVTCSSPPNNSYLKYWLSLLIDICKFPDFFSFFMYYNDKEQKPNPEEYQIRPFFLDLLIKEPPTMMHKDLQKSPATSMAWTTKLWLVLERYGLMQVVSALWICGMFNVLKKSDDAIMKLLVTKFKLLFETPEVKLIFFPGCNTNTEWARICFRSLHPSHRWFFTVITLWNNLNPVHTDL